MFQFEKLVIKSFEPSDQIEDHGGSGKIYTEVAVQATHHRVAGLSMSGHLLAFALDEVKLQAKGGRGLTLMDVDAKDPLVAVTTCGEHLQVQGLGRGDKPRMVELRGGSLEHHVGRRARKGRKVEGLKSGLRLIG